MYIVNYTCFSLPVQGSILSRPLSPTTQYHPSNLHIIPRCRVRDWTLSKDICIKWSIPQLSLLPFTMKSSLSPCDRPIRHASNICLRNKAEGRKIFIAVLLFKRKKKVLRLRHPGVKDADHAITASPFQVHAGIKSCNQTPSHCLNLQKYLH